MSHDDLPSWQDGMASRRANSAPLAWRPRRERASASSASGSTGRRPSAWQAIIRKKSDVEIVLDGHEDGILAYTTHEEIRGHVVLKFDKDAAIDNLVVTFEGQTSTFVEKVATTAPTSGRTTGKHTFLRMSQPINVSALPQNGRAQAGITYNIPFTFVVPDRLLPYVCSHPCANVETKLAHLQLPPTLGEPTVSGGGQALLDDLAPEMAKVTYTITAKLTKQGSGLLGRPGEVVERSQRVRLVPAREEAPPLRIDEEERDFVLRKEKSVKRGLFKIGQTGCMAAETMQPSSLRLPAPRTVQQEPVATVATIQLRFDPQTVDDQPPQLGSVVSKLRALTFYGAAAFKTIPSPKSMDNWSTLHGMYPESVDLSSRSLSTVTWTRHDADETPDLARRPSTVSDVSSTSIPEPSAAYAGRHFWTAAVIVPISLPKHKAFVPTFHHCIVARTYTLDLRVSWHTPGTSITSPSIALKVPIQISSAPSLHPVGGTQESEAALASEIERQFFATPEYAEEAPVYTSLARGMRSQSVAAPPEYQSGPAGRALMRSALPRSPSVSVQAAC